MSQAGPKLLSLSNPITASQVAQATGMNYLPNFSKKNLKLSTLYQIIKLYHLFSTLDNKNELANQQKHKKDMC